MWGAGEALALVNMDHSIHAIGLLVLLFVYLKVARAES